MLHLIDAHGKVCFLLAPELALVLSLLFMKPFIREIKILLDKRSINKKSSYILICLCESMQAFVPQHWIMASRNLVPRHSWPTSKETQILQSANYNVVQPQKRQCLCTETKENQHGAKAWKRKKLQYPHCYPADYCYFIIYLFENTD